MAELNDVSQAAFDEAESELVQLLRDAYPTLDLRRGTVLRDMLVRPAAAVYALQSDRLADLREKMSLNTIADSGTPDPDDVNAILANFNMTLDTGSNAAGLLRVKVSTSRTYLLSEGFTFNSFAGLSYVTTQNYTVKPDPDAITDLELRTSDDGESYYFLLPVVAAASGAEYNLSQGDALDAISSLPGIITAEAYVDFTAGVDSETLDQAIARIPVALSYRAFESRYAISGRLYDRFMDSEITLQAVSAQGYGDRTQLRDKHNPMGFAVGSRVDVYTRAFNQPEIRTLEYTADRVADNTYRFTINPAEAPGFYAIRAISDVEAVIAPTLNFGAVPVAGSYAFDERRTANGLSESFHDIASDNAVVETAYTIYQGSEVTVYDVLSTEEQYVLKVELYVNPGLAQMQAYMDDFEFRNLEGDHLVRCPLVVMTGIEAKAYYKDGNAIDEAGMNQAILDYINSRSFVRRLTRSEIANIILEYGFQRVDLRPDGMQLQGYVRDAGGTWHHLTGDVLDIESVYDRHNLLATETCVFGAEPHNIFIQPVPE